MRGGDTDENCVFDANRLCYECVEGMVTTLDACVPCETAQRCLVGSQDILCWDNGLLDGTQCTNSTQQDVLLITNNHVVKCGDGLFADGETCGDCSPQCASCFNASTCNACEGSTRSDDGACVGTDNAIVETHTGLVACADTFFADGAACSLCSERFGAGCSLCSAVECLACNTGFVLENGVCRSGDRCTVADGTVCQACEEESTKFNATDCVPSGDCAAYVDGRCVQCAEPLVLLTNGSCAQPDGCTALGESTCRRCDDGLFPGPSGTCQRLPHFTTHAQPATRPVQRAHSTRRSAPRATPRRGCS